MEKAELIYCTGVARTLLLASANNDRPAWNQAWDQVSGSPVYGQLTAYMICRAASEECGPGRPEWKSSSVIVIAGLRKDRLHDNAIKLFEGAQLLDDCHVENVWQGAWPKVRTDPDGLWVACRIVYLICRLEAGNEPGGRRMMLDTVASLSAWRRPGARFRCELRIARNHASWAWHALRRLLRREPSSPYLVVNPVSRRRLLKRPTLPEFDNNPIIEK